MKVFSCILAASLLIFLDACKKTDHYTAINKFDQAFVLQASSANKAEIGAGTLAESQGMRDSIRIFGAMMVTDHTASENTLDSIASILKITTAHGPDSLHQVIITNLMQLQGYTFDTAYIHGQVYDHQSTIRAYQDEITDGTNKLLQDFATKTLPVIQMHYNMAISISKSE